MLAGRFRTLVLFPWSPRRTRFLKDSFWIPYRFLQSCWLISQHCFNQGGFSVIRIGSWWFFNSFFKSPPPLHRQLKLSLLTDTRGGRVPLTLKRSNWLGKLEYLGMVPCYHRLPSSSHAHILNRVEFSVFAATIRFIRQVRLSTVICWNYFPIFDWSKFPFKFQRCIKDRDNSLTPIGLNQPKPVWSFSVKSEHSVFYGNSQVGG